jgi:RNA polymerase sigma-70 factor (ECF subfamily)
MQCNSLKPPYREIALDYFLKELTASEIAANTGKNLKTVQTQIYRAKAMLQKKYKKGAILNE